MWTVNWWMIRHTGASSGLYWLSVMNQATEEKVTKKNTLFPSSGVGVFRLTVSGNMGRAMVLFSSRSVNSLLSLLFSLMAGRILTVEEHGIYGKALASIVVFQAITELGMQFTLVRFLSPAIRTKDTERINAIVRASLKLKGYAFAATLGLMFIYVASVALVQFLALPISGLQLFNPDFLGLFWMIFLGGAGMSVISYLDAVLVSHEHYFRLSAWIPSVGALRIALFAFVYYFEDNGIQSEHAVFAYAFAPYVSMVLYFLLFPASFFFVSASGSHESLWIRRLLSFNVWILAASIMSIVSDWIEVLMITNIHDTGLYNAARLPMQGFLIILSTMQSLLLPRFSGLDRREEFARLFKKIYKYIAVLFVLLIPPGWLFMWFIPAWYGMDYEPSIGVFLILYPNFLLRIIFAPLGTALFALDQPVLIAVESGLRMIMGITFNIILIPLAGIKGAAWASLIAQSAGWIFLIIAYTYYFKKGYFPFVKIKHGKSFNPDREI